MSTKMPQNETAHSQALPGWVMAVLVVGAIVPGGAAVAIFVIKMDMWGVLLGAFAGTTVAIASYFVLAAMYRALTGVRGVVAWYVFLVAGLLGGAVSGWLPTKVGPWGDPVVWSLIGGLWALLMWRGLRQVASRSSSGTARLPSA